jgi:post-segregation antitoxin (ccd killing protein)
MLTEKSSIGSSHCHRVIASTKPAAQNLPSHALGRKHKMTSKKNVVLYLDKELVEKTRNLGFNLSKTFENRLKQLITRFSNANSKDKRARLGDALTQCLASSHTT